MDSEWLGKYNPGTGSFEFDHEAKQAPRAKRARAAIRQDEADAANRFLQAINSFSFDEKIFAFFVTSSNLELQPRILEIFIQWVGMWADAFHAGVMNPADKDLYNMAATCARIQDALDSYK